MILIILNLNHSSNKVSYMKLILDGYLENEFEISQELKNFGFTKQFHKGDTIYHKGEVSTGLYYINDGLVGLVNLSPNGTESLLRVFGHKFYFGYRSLISHEPYHASTVALTDVSITFLPFNSVNEILEKFPKLLIDLTVALSVDLRVAEDRLNDITGKKVINRIIESLIFLKHRYPEYRWTRREIGEFCGAKTETVTRALSELERLGLIEKVGREINILDNEKLISYSEEIELDD